jgi:hypothetical protein
MTPSAGANDGQRANEVFLGFDPAGQIGVALLSVADGLSNCVAGCLKSVDAALDWAMTHLGNQTGGIDAFLY